MELAFTYDDGRTETVEIRPIDLVAFERHFDLAWSEVEAKPRVEHVFYLGWSAAKRTGEARDFDTWLASVVDLDEKADAPLESPSA